MNHAERTPDPQLALPDAAMSPSGYVVMQHAVRLDRPVRAYARWMDRIPAVYREAVLDRTKEPSPPIAADPLCLQILEHYRSLMPMAMEARKPMFALRPADGAIGAHVDAVRSCYDDFRGLAREIARRCAIALPTS